MGTFGFAEWEKPEDADDVVKVRMQSLKRHEKLRTDFISMHPLLRTLMERASWARGEY
jgi:hypothetical protein